MKICLIGRGVPRIPPKAGIPVTIYMHTLAQQFTFLGHSVDVICAPASDREEQVYSIVEVGKPRLTGRNVYLQNLYEFWYSLCVGLTLSKRQRRNRYDIIHFFEDPATAFSTLLFARNEMPPILFSSGRPVSATGLAWESQSTPLPIRLASDIMHSYVFRKVTRVAVSSHRLRDVLMNRLRIAPEKVSVTPFISAEPDLFYPGIDCSELREKLGLSQDNLVVVCLGEVSPYKNQLSLVRAAPRIIQRHPEVRFIIAGGIVKEYYAQIQQFIQSQNLSEYVIFTGFIKDYAELPKYYNLADAYVLVSRSEGNLPKTILEAMSCGKAIVASDIPQNREGAKRGDEVIFVDPYDVEAIAKAINDLLGDPELRRKMGGNARRTVMEYHTPRIVAQGMLKVYEDIIASREVEGKHGVVRATSPDV